MKTKTVRRFEAILLGDDESGITVGLTRHTETIVTSSDGRRLYNHPQAESRAGWEIMETLTLAEASDLLRSLTDSIAFVAVEESDKREDETDA